VGVSIAGLVVNTLRAAGWEKIKRNKNQKHWWSGGEREISLIPFLRQAQDRLLRRRETNRFKI
jgi:hypothetical protein